MGLMLSVLVTCVGVIELITFYQKISRYFRDPPRQHGDFTIISERYIQELGSIRKRIAEGLKQYQETPPTLYLNSHEDIEIEYSKDLQNSRSPSPRRFLVTEKSDIGNSPRKFVVSQEPEGGLKKSKCHDSIPEFLIQQEKSLHKPTYVLKEKQNDLSTSPIPRQFIVSEDSLNTIVFEDVDFDVPETSVSRDKSPSPYLSQAPRNSICNELEGEPPLKYVPPHNSEKVDVILESKNFNTTEYWTNKVLVAPSKISKSRSRSREPENSKDSSEIEDLIRYDENYLNDLDGVSKAKTIKKLGASRRSVKRNNADEKQNSLDTTTVLKHAAEELEKVSVEEETSEASTSNVLDQKSGEPFWVKH